MKYNYMVKYKGNYYSAGTEVPIEEVNAGTSVPAKSETKVKTTKNKTEK